LDWVSSNALIVSGPGDDPDLDDLVNLAEFVFDLDPGLPSPSPLVIEATNAFLTAQYHPDPDRQRLVEVAPEWSTDLIEWVPVPEAHVTTGVDDVVTVSLPTGEATRFLRLQLSVRGWN
jgi:hypothetical protein